MVENAIEYSSRIEKTGVCDKLKEHELQCEPGRAVCGQLPIKETAHHVDGWISDQSLFTTRPYQIMWTSGLQHRYIFLLIFFFFFLGSASAACDVSPGMV